MERLVLEPALVFLADEIHSGLRGSISHGVANGRRRVQRSCKGKRCSIPGRERTEVGLSGTFPRRRAGAAFRILVEACRSRPESDARVYLRSVTGDRLVQCEAAGAPYGQCRGPEH